MKIIDDLVAREGGYVNHPADRGGPTKYGITLETLAAWRKRSVTAADVEALSMDEAKQIYEERYVVAPGFSAVTPAALREELVDSGVLHGPEQAVQWLQRALNALTGAGLSRDGVLGPKTRTTLASFLALRGADGVRVLLRILNALQCERMVELVERDPAQRAFVYGWVLHRVVI